MNGDHEQAMSKAFLQTFVDDPEAPRIAEQVLPDGIKWLTPDELKAHEEWDQRMQEAYRTKGKKR